jgi:hypothetical protein
LLISAKCGSEAKAPPVSARSIDRQSSDESSDSLHYLDIRNPSMKQAIDSKDLQGGPPRFVRVEVGSVTNPKKHSISFEVHYQPSRGARMFLGDFSLYPADNPGTFIVATQGRIRDSGDLIVSLASPDKISASDSIRVGVKRLSLVND